MKIMHIDANSAFLSWSSVKALEEGCSIDYRTVPAVVGGNQASRHGIVLAKSIPSKAFGITTGESIMEARKKCPNLLVIPPDYDLYVDCSNAMYRILCEYSPLIQRYSIDECFLDYTASEKIYGDPLQTAYIIKDRIKSELGFTVNVGLSCNKLLAKMAGELKKPDMVHTLWPEEIPCKLHPLPVGELFMVGRSSEKKLKGIGINTIGDLAHMDKLLAKAILKSQGELIWNYANGIDYSLVELNSTIIQKGVGNSMTIWYDVTDFNDACSYILSLSEQVGMRLRRKQSRASVVSLHIRNSDLFGYSHQVKLDYYTNSTDEIYDVSCTLFSSMWRGEPIRQIGVHTSGLSYSGEYQISFLDPERLELNRQLDNTVDDIRRRYGRYSIMRARFANSGLKPVEGGVNDGNFIGMGGYSNEDSSQTY